MELVYAYSHQRFKKVEQYTANELSTVNKNFISITCQFSIKSQQADC
jgi:hypothetical protein